MSDPEAYTVAWICAVTAESVAARAFLDEEHAPPRQVAQHDNNSYVLGSIGSHNIVVAALPEGEYGTTSAAAVARDLVHTFPNVRIGLMVGIGGGAPSQKHDIRLGDIVVSSPGSRHGGVFQYDFGKTIQNCSFQETGFLNQPPVLLRTALATLRATYEMKGHQLVEDVNKNLEKIKKRSKYKQPSPTSDRLYKSHIVHPLNSSDGCDIACGNDTACLIDRPERDEEDDDPAIHYGLIASGNQLMKDACIRDRLAAEKDVLCFEMEAAGLINHFPCLVIRGICDYSDSHKNKAWQGFAAMIAAAYARDLLRQIAPNGVEAEKQIREVLGSIHEDVQRLNQTADETRTGVMTIQSHQTDHTHRLIHIEQGVKDLKLSKVEDLSIARSPHFVVPFPSDPDFVNRSDIWTWIEEQYAGPNSRFALVGMGGFGKSQMAIQFTHRLHATSPKTSIFWVNASAKATFEESYRSIADVLALPRRHDPDANVLALVRDWLQREDVSPWLMIVDNADDVELLFSKTNGQKDVLVPTASYLPKTDNGKMLVTSRSWDVAEKLVGKGRMIFRVPTMQEAQALQLLRKKLDHGSDEVAALRLVHTLGCIPLAVNQAAAYIFKRSQRSPLTIQIYLDELQKSEQRKGTLLRSDRGDVRRYDDVSNSVVLTWQLTFNQIKREQPRAADLLSLMSYFHAQNIPQYMLHGYNSGFISATEGDDDDDDLEDDLDVLHAYSLISTTTSGFCEMHPLVQFCTKVWISEFGSPGQWKTFFLQSASEHFPSGKFETWQQCQTLMPHIQPLLDKQPLEERDLLEWSKLLTNVSWYLLMLGNYARAEVIVQDAVRIRTERLGEEHSSTLTSMANLASTYMNQGRWKEAEELFVQVIETRKRVLGEEHPDTLTSMDNLAATFWSQARWKEAEELFVRVMETRKRVLGEEHPDTLTSMANLAATYRNQGRWKDAEELEMQVIETSKRVLGEEHPDTLTSMANLAATYRSQGRWKEAEELEMQVMETRKRVLGEEHPSTLKSMANLAATYGNQGRWKEAEQLEVRVMETSFRVLREEHASTLTSMANLASTYMNQGRWKEAEELFVQVIETRKRVLGEEHPDTLTSMDNLASTFWNQGRWKEAEELFVQVIETRKRVIGEEHPDTLTSMDNLASTYRNQGRWKEAEELFVRVMQTRKSVLGEEHPDTLASMDNLAATYRSQGRWKEAEKLFVQVIETRKRVLGEEHPDTLTSMDNLASTFWNQGRWKEAEELFVQVIETRKRVIGEEHPDTLTSMNNLTLTYRNQGRWKEAEELFVRVMQTRKSVLGEEHPDTLTSMNNLTLTYWDQGRWKEAEELFVRVMETSLRVLGDEHPLTLTSMNNLAFTWKKQERWEDAIQLLRNCVRLRGDVLGVDHPNTMSSVSALSNWELELKKTSYKFP